MGTTSTRQRRIDYGKFSGTYTSGGCVKSVKEITLFGQQKTTSEGHFWPSRKVTGGDQGGPFLSQKNGLLRSGAGGITVSHPAPGSCDESYNGIALPTNNQSIGPNYLGPSTDDELVVYGTRLIALARPVAPLSGVGVTLGELRNDGLPHMIGHSLKEILSNFRKVPKAGSQEFLNWEFGWKPLWSDVMKTVKNVQHSHKIITQLYRDSGKPVRRRIALPMSKEVSVGPTLGHNYYCWPGQYMTAYLLDQGFCQTTVTTTVDLWFSGSFTYFIPHDDSILSKSRRFLMEANRIAGLRPDPELLWNLAPWSWLSDWFINTGDVIANATSYALDGLVMNYGYQMEHKKEVTDIFNHTSFEDGAGFNSFQSWSRESKRRIRATPFGFGLNPSVFTPKQWAILAAIGISRGPNTLSN